MLLCASGLGVANAPAATLSGDFFNLEFDGAASLFGAPTIGANAVKFLPTVFYARVLGPGPASISTTATIDFTLTAKAGYGFTSFAVSAIGDYSRLFFGSDASDSTVDASGQLTVRDLASPGASLSLPVVAGGFGPTGNNKAWQAQALINPPGSPFSDPLTEVSVSWSMQLDAAVVDLGTQAKIQMKLGRLLVGVEKLPDDDPEVVPIPSSALLFGTAIAAVAGFSRRARRH